MTPTATGDTPWSLLMWTHDNGKILRPALNNNTSPRGLNQTCFSLFLARQRREQVLLEERGAEGNGGGVLGMCCWGMSWVMKRHPEGINERAWRPPAPGGKRGRYCSTDNELPKSEEIASAAAVRNFSCQSLEMLYSLTGRRIRANMDTIYIWMCLYLPRAR